MDISKYKILAEDREIFNIPKYSDKEFRESLRDLLNASGATPVILCEYLGGSLDLVNRYIYGEVEIPIDRLPPIAKFFGIESSYFLEYRVNKLFKKLEDNPDLIDIFLELAQTHGGSIKIKENTNNSEYAITEIKRGLHRIPEYSGDVFSYSLRVLLEASGATLEELSEGIGVEPIVISRMLNGSVGMVKLEIIMRISYFFNVKPEFFSEYLFLVLWELVKAKPKIINSIFDIYGEEVGEIEKKIRDSQENNNQHQVDLQPMKQNYINVRTTS